MRETCLTNAILQGLFGLLCLLLGGGNGRARLSLVRTRLFECLIMYGLLFAQARQCLILFFNFGRVGFYLILNMEQFPKETLEDELILKATISTKKHTLTQIVITLSFTSPSNLSASFSCSLKTLISPANPLRLLKLSVAFSAARSTSFFARS